MVHTLELPQTPQVPQAKPCPGFVRTVLPTLRSAIYQFMNSANGPGKQGRQTSLRQMRKLRLREGRDCLELYNKGGGRGRGGKSQSQRQLLRLEWGAHMALVLTVQGG